MTGPVFWRDLYGPGYDPKNRYPMSGDDVVAVRRVVSRMGFMDWDDALSSSTYGKGVEQATAAFQATIGIQPTGHWGKPTHDMSREMRREGHESEPAWDAYSTELYDQAINYAAPHACVQA